MIPVLDWLDGMFLTLPPLLHMAVWAVLCSGISMGLYARLSPQEKMRDIKTRQKSARRELLAYEGEWDGLPPLLFADIGLSARHFALTIVPVAVSAAPVIGLMFYLSDRYGHSPQTYLPFGPDWMRGFECYFLLVMAICSLIIKIRFKIA